MAEFQDLETRTYTAAADLSGKQYHFIRVSAVGAVNQASEAANLNVRGVLQNKPQSGEFATIAIRGKTKCYAGAAIAQDALVTTNGSGRATTILSGTNGVITGRAVTAAGADGDIISIELQDPYPFPGLAY